MKPNRKLAETTTPSGGRLILYEHDGSYCIRLNGEQLMHSAVATSELLLGEVAVEGLAERPEVRVLIGGLGLGFTLRSVLERVGPGAKVQVAELIPEVVEWNRQFLTGVNGALLEDPRVEVLVSDVRKVIAGADKEQYDALLLDVDNGPTAMVQPQNAGLYSRSGLQQLAAVLKPGGRAAIWSAGENPAFPERLERAGFRVKVVPAKRYATAKRHAYTVYVAEKGE